MLNGELKARAAKLEREVKVWCTDCSCCFAASGQWILDTTLFVGIIAAAAAGNSTMPGYYRQQRDAPVVHALPRAHLCSLLHACMRTCMRRLGFHQMGFQQKSSLACASACLLLSAAPLSTHNFLERTPAGAK